MAARKGPLRAGKLTRLRMSQLEQGRFQPRRAIDGVGLEKLAESVRSEGVLQPLYVRRTGYGRFEIVAGERRWLAAKLAGLNKVPVVVGKVSDAAALLIALVENLHREELNPIDQAHAIRVLVEKFSMTHEEIAAAIGRSRVTVTNLSRLLELPAAVKEMLADGKLEMGHARALLALPAHERPAAAERVVGKRLSVRAVERMAHEGTAPEAPTQEASDEHRFASWLREKLGRGFALRRKASGRWNLKVDFSDLAELEATLERIEQLVRELRRSER
jgi:ParB family chromosome partitioning protein